MYGEPTINKDDVIKKVYFNRLPKELYKWYFKENINIYNIVCELGKPQIYGNNINMCKTFMHTQKPYNEYSDDIKSRVDKILDFYLNCWCSGDKEQFEYLINWIANMARGNKNQTMIYIKCMTQGIGKSTGCEFIFNNVIGDDLSIETGSQPLKT